MGRTKSSVYVYLNTRSFPVSLALASYKHELYMDKNDLLVLCFRLLGQQ